MGSRFPRSSSWQAYPCAGAVPLFLTLGTLAFGRGILFREVIKRGKEKHNPDGTGDTIKKYLWFYKMGTIMKTASPGMGRKAGQYVYKL
jgi:hypothetical protein